MPSDAERPGGLGIGPSQILAGGCVLFFVVAPVVIASTVRSGWYSVSEVIAAVLVGVPVAAYAVIRSSGHPTVARAPFLQPVAPILLLAVGVVTVVALLALPSLDALRISREYERVETLPMRLLNLHLVATFLAASWAFGSRQKNALHFVAVLSTTAVSLTVAFAEGRRTAAVLPVLIVGLLWISSTAVARQAVTRTMLTLSVAIAVFLSVTSVRVAVDVAPDVAANALLSRVFNTGTSALEVVSSGDYSFNPRLPHQIVSRVTYVFGIGSYFSRTNEFGVHYGFLAPSNASVGINPGIAVESMLQWPWIYPIFCIALIEVALALLRAYASLLHGTDLLLALLLVHGFQMEVPYTVGLLVRLAAVAAPILLLRHLIRRSETAQGLPSSPSLPVAPHGPQGVGQ